MGARFLPRVNAMKPASSLSGNNWDAARITAASLVPHRSTIPVLRKAASTCTACDLRKTATQTVFGEGTSKTMIMIVGEQPGDQEDRVGRPFVGPAGKLLDEGLAEVGIGRDGVRQRSSQRYWCVWERPLRKRCLEKIPFGKYEFRAARWRIRVFRQ
jgi:uracil-DNA glycosylase